jgi:3',5'-cyclic AMP phosphodiesterase CpdA
MIPRTAEFARPEHFIIHISDTHFVAEGDLYGTVDEEGHLRQLFGELEASGARPEAIIITGDLTDRGESIAYARLRSLVDPAAARLGASVIWVMGNHDAREPFRTELLDEPPSDTPVDAVYVINGLRIIALDSTVPGKHHGEISTDQLEWLAQELATPAPHGTVLALHHPPIPSVLDLAVLVELRDQDRLARVIRGTDIRTIIAGHLHYSSTATFAGIPVSVASATCYTQDLNVAVGGTKGRDGAQSFNLVHLFEETVLHSVVPVGQFSQVSFRSPAETAAALLREGFTIRAAGSGRAEKLTTGRQ